MSIEYRGEKFSGYNKPKASTKGGKSHVVLIKDDGKDRMIRFGQEGATGSPRGTARNDAFRARHATNIAKGKTSAAYWSAKVKWQENSMSYGTKLVSPPKKGKKKKVKK